MLTINIFVRVANMKKFPDLHNWFDIRDVPIKCSLEG